MESNSYYDQPNWQLAKDGIDLLLNNQQEEAEKLFKKFPDSNEMYCGYATTVFMDAFMSFEEEKLVLATQTLKEMERRCSTTGWFKMVRGKIFESDTMSYADHLETQIIKADTQLFIATLTFLQQDISAYFKGGWILRKSWKHYDQTYNEIQTLYKQIVGETPPVRNSPSTEIVSSTVTVAVDEADQQQPQKIDLLNLPSEMEIFDKNEILHSMDITESQKAMEENTNNTPGLRFGITRNGYLPKSNTTYFHQQQSPSKLQSTTPTATATPNLRKSQSAHSGLSKYTQIQQSLARFSPFNSNTTLAYISSFNPFHFERVKPIDIDKETITRLMCGVSFGYGLLQLGMSLLPPSILKLTNFLGFQGNRKSGLMNLMYARSGSDMRAPLATLALLWYHTIVRPFFSLDGHNVQAGVQAAAQLIDDSQEKYANSSLFLFFKGRVERLRSDISSAIVAFNASIDNSQHREIRILSLHEVGWCYLIELNYYKAMTTFLKLKQQSRWSRCFYAYMAAISGGAEDFLKDMDLVEELKVIFGSTPKGTQLDDFLGRRFVICPKTSQEIIKKPKSFWKLLIYELLYLWNSLPSCSVDSIQTIISDCTTQVDMYEPYVGLSMLIAGSAYCSLKDYENGIKSFRSCLEARQFASLHADDAHISAFALYELGQLLIREPDTKSEGKQCLQQVSSYQGYDFEQRLSVRIHSILKHL